MQRFVTVLVATLLLAAAARANPIMVGLLSEIQVAPDSEQKLEVNSNHDPSIRVDMSGWQVISRACTLTVDSGVVIPDTGMYIVLDSNNLSGSLRLDPDSDEITLQIPDSPEPMVMDQVSYPGPQGWGSCFRPPAGMSVAPYYYWVGHPGEEYLERLWFVESLPTFGQANPETASSISGRVLDQQAQPVCSAVVSISGPEGSTGVLSGSNGIYVVDWLGPGTFQATATKSGQTGAYQDSVCVTQHGYRDSINITIPLSGVAQPSLVRVRMDWRGNWLRVRLPEPALADLSTVNVAGRVCARLREMLAAGETELHPLGALPAGVYLVQGAIGKEKVNRKVTVFK